MADTAATLASASTQARSGSSFAQAVDRWIYPLLAIAPMFVWDLVRTRAVHKAYMIWALVSLPAAILVHTLWDSEWWHAMARLLVGV